MDHYSNIVMSFEGRCWRMVVAGNENEVHPVKCPEPVAWVGRHQWRTGEWSTVWSCDGHADDLTDAEPIVGSSVPA